jgi:hypothetical protein
MMLDRKLLVPKTELLSEVAEDEVEVPAGLLRKRTRRDVLLFGATALAALTAGTTLLPEETLQRLGLQRKLNPPGKEWLLDRAIRIDDDVAEALYSPHRLVPT